MFDMTFDIMMAFQQAGFLLGGGLCALIGGAILLHTLHTYLYARRVPAVITGVRRDGKMFYPVYKYMMPNGDTFEEVSDTGSGFIKGKETGREVMLYVFESDPQGIRSDLRAAIFIGLVFLVPGLVLLAHGIFSFPFTPATWVSAAIFLLVAAQRLKKTLLPKDGRPDKQGFRAQIRKRRSGRFLAAELTTIEAYLQTPAGRRMQADTEKSLRVGTPLAFLFGLGALGFAWHMGTQLRDLTLYGQQAQGVIERFDARQGSDHKTMYRAKIGFTDARGDHHVFAAKVATSSPRGRVGDIVNVIYLPDAPAESAMIDGGLWLDALWPLLLALLGGGVLLGAFHLLGQIRTAKAAR
ncbi:MAG: DUF3592 domain-containing protein [Alphaproteobacteria bacterium]